MESELTELGAPGDRDEIDSSAAGLPQNETAAEEIGADEVVDAPAGEVVIAEGETEATESADENDLAEVVVEVIETTADEAEDVSAAEPDEPTVADPAAPSQDDRADVPYASHETIEVQALHTSDDSAGDESGVDESTTPEPTDAQAGEAVEEWFDPEAVPPQLKRGEVIDGVVTETSPTSVLVDVGMKSEGIIPGRELERMTRTTLDMLRPGNTVPVYIVNPNNHQGNIILSVNRALEERDWQEATSYQKSKDVYDGHIAGYNKGGLIVRFGRLRGFVPQSQVSDVRRRLMVGDTPEERYGKMVNEPIGVKVMEVDRSRNRLILSERAATRESREKRKETLVSQLQVGEVRQGRVASLEDFGVFVDIGGAEGLVHLTELTWKHVNHPRDVVEIGQEVKVEVISVDRERMRIGLSIKRQAADPWDEIATAYSPGQLVQAVVTKLTKFGAFAQLVESPEIEGLVHISELSDQRVNHPREVVDIGAKLTLRVVKLDVKDRRLGLSLKSVNSAEYLDLDWNRAADDAS